MRDALLNRSSSCAVALPSSSTASISDSAHGDGGEGGVGETGDGSGEAGTADRRVLVVSSSSPRSVISYSPFASTHSIRARHGAGASQPLYQTSAPTSKFGVGGDGGGVGSGSGGGGGAGGGGGDIESASAFVRVRRPSMATT